MDRLQLHFLHLHLYQDLDQLEFRGFLLHQYLMQL